MNARTTGSAVGKSTGVASHAHAKDTSATATSGTSTSGASARISSTQPATSRAIGPTWSKVGASGNTPSTGTCANDGLNPTIRQHAAGILIDPPVSVPSAPSASPAASAAADPPLDPPAVSDASTGFGTTP